MSSADPDPDAIKAITAAMIAAGAHVSKVETTRPVMSVTAGLVFVFSLAGIGVAAGIMGASMELNLLLTCGPFVVLVVWLLNRGEWEPKGPFIQGDIICAAAGDLPALVTEPLRSPDYVKGVRVTAQAFVVATSSGLVLLDPACLRLYEYGGSGGTTIIPIGATVRFVDGNRRTRPLPPWAAGAVPVDAYRGARVEELVAGDEAVVIMRSD